MRKIILIIILTLTINVSAQTIIEDTFFNNKTLNWTKAGSPYIIKNNITLVASTLNISDAKVIFENAGISFFNNSVANINNVEIEDYHNNYVFSIFNSKINIKDLNLNSDKFIESYNSEISLDNIENFNAGLKSLFLVNDNSTFSLINSHIENHKGNVLNFNNTKQVNIKNTEFVNNFRVISLNNKNSVSINNNDFEHNNIAIESFMFDYDNSTINLEDNFFEKVSPIIHSYSNEAIQGEYNILSGPFTISRFSLEKNVKEEQLCCSNVIFLPGLMGSRLYMDGLTQNQLWEPNRNTDVKKLFLNNLGQSINSIYTKDVINKTNLLIGLPSVDQNIYKDFITYLDKLIKDKTINHYNAMPYDWRLSIDEILDNGINLKDKNIDLIKTIQDLQKTSKTKKVTIITHSNGGLLAKQLIYELKKNNLDNMIDKIIFVAMPEYGTPQAVTSLVYGHGQSILGGLILKSSIAKDLGKNMATAYMLLPSEKYYAYRTIDKTLNESVINGYNGLNSTLLNKAKEIHSVLDNLIYPSHIAIYQIVGTGINTVKDITDEITPIYDKNGDGVVQDLYGLRFGTTTYIDLKDTKSKHANIMNNDKVILNIENILTYKNEQYGLDYNKIIKNNNYKLLKIKKSKNKISEYLTPLDMDLSIGMSKLNNNVDNELFFDKYHANSLDSFNKVVESLDNNNRFELSNESVNYLYTKEINELSINSKTDNYIDISILENIDNEINEIEYTDLPLFKDIKVSFTTDDAFQTLHVSLPSLQNILYLENKKTETSSNYLLKPSTEEILKKIIIDIKASNIERYLKDRYVRRIEVYRKNTDSNYLNLLKDKLSESIVSINKLAYSPILKARYSKVKEDYIYLKLLLLKL